MRTLQYLLAAPFGILLTLLYFSIRFFIRVEPIKSDVVVPDDALVFFSHPQIYALAFSPHIRKNGGFELWVVGFHGFIPYIWTILDRIVGIHFLLFDRKSKERPFSQIVQLLKEHPDKKLAVATDSGGPYGKLKPSLLKMALEADRPLVGIAAAFSKEFKLLEHRLPLPGAKLEFAVMTCIPLEELKTQPETETLARLQRALDQICNFRA